MVQAFPPNTGVGWYTMATGTYPSEHGSTNNTFFRAGDAFSNRTAFSAAGVLQADTIANAAERAGKKVAQIDWVGGAAANIAGPTVDFTNFFSNRGVLVGAADPVEQAGSAFFGVTYQVSAAPVAAAGWTGVPTGDPAAPPKETTWAIPSTFAAQNPSADLQRLLLRQRHRRRARTTTTQSSARSARPARSPSIDLKVGDFLPIKLTAANGLIGARAGQTVGHYVKLISLAPNLSNFKLYDTSLARAIAKCGAPCNGLPAGGAGEDRLEKYIADNLLPWAAADFAPEEAGVIDEDTYVQQGRDLERAYSLQVINFILGTLQPDTDLAMVGYPFTDEVSHQFMGLVSPTEPDGSPNPCYDVNPKFDDVQCTGRGTAHRVEAREGYIRSAYEDADEKLGITRELMGGNPATFAGSDHGFAPQAYAVNANQVLNSATVGGVSLHASGGGASNCSAVGGAPVAPPTAPNPGDDIAKACWAGGTIQIYVNPNRLKNAAQPTSASFPTYEEVRTAVRDAFQSLADPAHPGDQVVSAILNKEDLRNVDGSDSLHPNRSGDVVVVLRPPYQSDAGTAGQKIALSHFFGQHGYLPDYVDLKNNINMHAVFVLGGPGVKHKQGIAGLRAIDVAPTLSFLMDIPGPQNARGRILYDLVKGAEGTREITILDISDWHAQLTPLAEASDTLGPSFGIAGSAFLKRWFDLYEAESALSGGSVIEVAGGDSFGGATPPISNFFGDKPTPPIMGMMGIDVDVPREPQLRPRADVPADGADPARAVPDALGERRLPGRHDAAGVVEVDGARPRARREARRRRLHHRVDARDRLPGEPRPVRGPARRPGGQRRGGGARERNRRDPRPRARGGFVGHGRQPVGPADRHRRQRHQRRRGDRRPQRRPGRRAARERCPRDREPRQGHPLHAHAPRDRPGQRRRRLQDGRLPQAVEHRPDAGPGDPGQDRRAERTAGADPRHADRQLDEVHPAGRPVRTSRRAAL